MELNKLQVSNLNISEDEYIYKGLFTLTGEGVSMNVDLAELEDAKTLNEIKNRYYLAEKPEEIRKVIMSKVMEQASVSSRIREGEEFQEGQSVKVDRSGTLDMS